MEGSELRGFIPQHPCESRPHSTTPQLSWEKMRHMSKVDSNTGEAAQLSGFYVCERQRIMETAAVHPQVTATVSMV